MAGSCIPSRADRSGHLLEHDSATLVCRSWTLEQIKRSEELHIAVLYASAYGNTAGMAQVAAAFCQFTPKAYIQKAIC